MLAYPAALGAATLVLAAKGLWKPIGVLTAAVCVGFALWSALEHGDLSRLTIRTWTTAPLGTPGLALEGTRARSYPDASQVAYAALGRNSEDGHAALIDESIGYPTLYFHPDPFYQQKKIDEGIACGPSRGTRLVGVHHRPLRPHSGRARLGGVRSRRPARCSRRATTS